MAEHRVADGRLAELARHGHMLGVIEMLVPEENNLPLQERVPHLLQLPCRQRPAEVDAPDLRTDVQGEWNDLDGVRCSRTDGRLKRRDHLFPSSVFVSGTYHAAAVNVVRRACGAISPSFDALPGAPWFDGPCCNQSSTGTKAPGRGSGPVRSPWVRTARWQTGTPRPVQRDSETKGVRWTPSAGQKPG